MTTYGCANSNNLGYAITKATMIAATKMNAIIIFMRQRLRAAYYVVNHALLHRQRVGAGDGRDGEGVRGNTFVKTMYLTFTQTIDVYRQVQGGTGDGL